jgi:hypothetical protein
MEGTPHAVATCRPMHEPPADGPAAIAHGHRPPVPPYNPRRGACATFAQGLGEAIENTAVVELQPVGFELTGARAAVLCPALSTTQPGTATCAVAVGCPPGFSPVACGCRVAQRGDDAFWILYSQQWADTDAAGKLVCNCWWTNLGRTTSAQFQGLVDATCARKLAAAAATEGAAPSAGPEAAPIPLGR